jgi:CubicO group peptidase (beta-lactamase class C family)
MLLPALLLLLSPEDFGFDRAKLNALRDDLTRRNTQSLLIMRRGEIVYEWHAPGRGPDRTHYTASMAKAIVTGLSLMLAIEDGRLQPDDLASKYIPAWRGDPVKSKITIRHLATHTSGIEDAEQDNIPHDKLPGWKGNFWKRTPDPFSIAIHKAPVIFDPGSKYAYSNPGIAALNYAVTAALRGAPQSNIHALLRERVLVPLGIADDEWSIGYGKAHDVDGLKLYAGWGGGGFTPRAVARIGQLMLDRGMWRNRRLISRATVDKALEWAGMPGAAPPSPVSGLSWWLNARGSWPRIPKDAFAGAGAGHQILFAVPSLDLVAVRNGGLLAHGPEDRHFWKSAHDYFLQPLVDAVVSAPPYPQSSAIRRISFAPEESIVIKAKGSDNWPLTWGDDDSIYTSYGDGWGFEPLIKPKLSMGFARVLGPPENFTAENIRSQSGERSGDGRKGPKSSGMLMVDGLLYMWVRNTGNAELWWSPDHATTWRQAFRFTESFATPCFLNFGRNYAGARDNFVYAYSQDGPDAYQPDDQMILARAPKDRVRDRSAWEFYAGDSWTQDIAACRPVLRFPRRCERSDAVYNPGLKRYLLAVGYGHTGGWGIFDASEPWGPWSIAFHTESWGLPFATHGYRLPAKWISPDGRTMWLVFTGLKTYDAFCVRKMTLE